MTGPDKGLADAVKRGHALLGEHATMQTEIQKIFVDRNAKAAASGVNSRIFFGTPKEIAAQRAVFSTEAKAASAAGSILPRGFGGGRVAAIVAGIAIAGAGIYAFSHKKSDQTAQGGWTNRIDAERTNSQIISR